MMTTNQPSKIAARYPGKCLCGARFQPGAKIYWDFSARIATGCPACLKAARRTIAGDWTLASGGLLVRFDSYADTGEVAACVITTQDSGHGVYEVYRLVDGQWRHHHTNREPVLSGVASHATIEGWRSLSQMSAEDMWMRG